MTVAVSMAAEGAGTSTLLAYQVRKNLDEFVAGRLDRARVLLWLPCATCRLRWYFPEEERMMQYSRDKYFPQLRSKVINTVGGPSKIPLNASAHTKANTCTQHK